MQPLRCLFAALAILSLSTGHGAQTPCAAVLPPRAKEQRHAHDRSSKAPAEGPTSAYRAGPITAVAFSPDGSKIAVGGLQVVTLLDTGTGQTLARWQGHVSAVTSVVFSPDGRTLAAASGRPGRFGEIRLWDMSGRKLKCVLTGPVDMIYAVAFRPDGKLLAAASYDRVVSLWNLAALPASSSGLSPFTRLRDHTDAVYAVAFSPDGSKIASAAGDRTVKIWDAKTGKRLVTFSESTGELYTLAFRPNGKQLAAGGADKTLRIWNLTPEGGALARSAFAHEGAILRLTYGQDGSSLITAGDDNAVKRWDAESLAEQQIYAPQPDWPQDIAINPSNTLLAVGRHDGSLALYELATGRLRREISRPGAQANAAAPAAAPEARRHRYGWGRAVGLLPGDERPRWRRSEEGELWIGADGPDVPARPQKSAQEESAQEDPAVQQAPDNDLPARAQHVPLPVRIHGTLWNGTLWNGHADREAPAHYYRFTASKGETLVLDVLARRNGSPLDSLIAVLDAQGRPIERATLRAVGQTEVTLSDRDSASPGIRLLALPDLKLKDYVLVGRELIQVVALPKGPDDDTQFRSFRGQRTGFLGTTPEFHSVTAPVYKVEIHPPGSVFSPNGMPLTRLPYVNDDGGPLYGKDSYLEFTAPANGDYLVRLTDARGQQGEKYTYQLRIHPPRPDFKVSLSPSRLAVPQGGAATVTVECERYDGFQDAVAIELENLPPGFTATRSVIEAGETSAILLLSAAPDAVVPMKADPIRLVARATIDQRAMTRAGEPGKPALDLTAAPPAKVQVATDRREVVIHPGEETVVEARIIRQAGFGGRVPVDIRNLPFGVRVLHVGLNGVLITEKEITRPFVLWCEPWVTPQERLIYTVANVEGGGGTAAPPLMLKVEPRLAPVTKAEGGTNQ